MDVLPNSGRLPEEEDSGNEIRGDSSQKPGIGRETITTQSTKSAPAPAATPPPQTNTDPVVSFKGPFWDNSNATDRVLPESHENQEWQWTVDNNNPAVVNWIAWLSSPALNTPSSTTIEKIDVEGPVGRRLSMPPSKGTSSIFFSFKEVELKLFHLTSLSGSYTIIIMRRNIQNRECKTNLCGA